MGKENSTTTAAKRKAKKNYKGTVLKRGSVYYWRHKTAKGAYTMTVLRDSHGVPITTQQEAVTAVQSASDELAELKRLTDKLSWLQEMARIRGLIQNLRNIPLDTLERLYFTESPEAESNGYSKRVAVRAFVQWIGNAYPQINSANNVSPEIAVEYMDHYWKQGITGHAYNSRLACLRSIFRFVQGKASPFADIPRKHHTSEGRNSFSSEQLAAIWKTLHSSAFRVQFKEEFSSVLVFALHTGARCGDICLMQRAHILADCSQIRFKPAKTQHYSSRAVCIPCSPVLRALLLDILNTSSSSDYLFPNIAEWYIRNPTGIMHATTRLLELSGIQTKENSKQDTHRQKSIIRYSFHSFRHTFASLLANSGTPLITVSALLGHTSITTTQRYSHASDTSKLSAVSALQNTICGEF